MAVAQIESRERTLYGSIDNKSKNPLSLLTSKKWVGNFPQNFPNPLSEKGEFTQCVQPPEGVKTAVVYSGKNRCGVDCGWLFAWADSKVHEMKVYVECGPKGKFNHIDWPHIEGMLNKDEHGGFSKYSDKETGTSVEAFLLSGCRNINRFHFDSLRVTFTG